MASKRVVLYHFGNGNVCFQVDEVSADQRLALAFESATVGTKGRLIQQARFLGVNANVLNIVRRGFIHNGCVCLYGIVGRQIDTAVCADLVLDPVVDGYRLEGKRFDFATAVQVDGDMVWKVDRRVLSEARLHERLLGYGRVQQQFLDELQAACRKLRHRAIAAAGSVVAIALLVLRFLS